MPSFEQLLQALMAQQQSHTPATPPNAVQQRQGRVDKGLDETHQSYSRGPSFDGNSGGLPWQAAQSMEGGDPIVAIAERLGKLRGAIEGNSGSIMPSNASRFNSDLSQQIGPLQEIFNLYKKKLEGAGRGPTAMPMSLPPQSGRGGPVDSLANNMNRASHPGETQAGLLDPYARAREAAIKASVRYLNVENPHLLESLKNG